MELVNIITPEAQEQTLEKLKVEIVQYDAGVRSAFGRQMGYAYLAGLSLNQAKSLSPHGKFMAWAKTNLPTIPHRTATCYMGFTDKLEGKFPTVGKLATIANLKSGHLLTAGELSPEELEVIVSAVHDAADGKTLTEFYRDLGVIRQPKKHIYHPPKPSSPEAQVKAEIFMADETGRHLATELIMLAEDRDAPISHMSDAVRERLLDACVAVSTRIRGMGQQDGLAKRAKRARRPASPETKSKMQAAAKARWAKIARPARSGASSG